MSVAATLSRPPNIIERLVVLAASESHLSQDEILAAIADPRWDEAGRVHDWRNHVSEAFAELWGALSVESRLVAFVLACEESVAEDWDSRSH